LAIVCEFVALEKFVLRQYANALEYVDSKRTKEVNFETYFYNLGEAIEQEP